MACCYNCCKPNDEDDANENDANENDENGNDENAKKQSRMSRLKQRWKTSINDENAKEQSPLSRSNDIEQSTDANDPYVDIQTNTFDIESNDENALLLNKVPESDVVTEEPPPDIGVKELVELVFKTEHADIESYHKKIWQMLMNVAGFKRIIHEVNVNPIAVDVGEMKFILKIPIDTAMENKVVQNVLMQLEDQFGIVRINVGVKKLHQQRVKLMDEEEASDEAPPDWQDLIKLTFKTKSEVVELLHEEIDGKMIDVTGFEGLLHAEIFHKLVDVTGFEQKVWHSKDHIIDQSNGEFMFILRHSADTAMEDAVIQRVLEVLKDDHRVSQIELDENMPPSVPRGQRRVTTKLTHAIQLQFIAKVEKGFYVRDYADRLTERLMRLKYFMFKMYEKKVTIEKDHKATFQFVMYHSGDSPAVAMKDPELLAAVEILKAERKVKRLQVNVIPYFLEK